MEHRVKRRKVEYFPTVSKIEYEGPESTNPLAFKYYNADEVIMGRPMREWCRFAACWWQTFNGKMGTDPFSSQRTHLRSWDRDGLWRRTLSALMWLLSFL